MAGKNLGTGERIVRFIIGLAVGAWAVSQPDKGVVAWLALLAATFLVLNALFGRCYLWQWLRINTREGQDLGCNREAEPPGDTLRD